MKLTNFNIVWYVLCWNEMPILPFMIDYWSKIANKVVVFDNNSDDGSVDYLKQYDWIEVRPYPIPTNNQVNDDIHRRIKDSCWKECKDKGVDWVIVSDLDETIWAKDLQKTLEFAKDNNVDVCIPDGYDFVSLTFPEYKEGLLLHDQIKTCMKPPITWDKPIIFNPNNVNELNSCVGGHYASPVCKGKMNRVNGLFLFHFKYLSLDYLIEKRFATAPCLAEINIRNRWGFEYQYNREQITTQFNDRWYRAKDNSIDKIMG